MVDVLGTSLGRYEIRERIGRGGMATVYKGWDTTLERVVAIKVLHDFLSDDRELRERFGREAKLVAGLTHPNIVGMFDYQILDQNGSLIYYMVMPFIQGRSLRSLLEQKNDAGARMTLDEISRIVQDIGGALAYAHQQGAVHRDVTPGNILLDERGHAVLADFGIARMVSSTRLTRTGTTSGTPLYMSPEQSMGDSGDQRSDIYSFGIILFEMLTGKPPYQGDSAYSIMMKHVNDPIPSPLAVNSQLPAGLESVLFRALAKEPDERYQTMDDLMAEFAEAIESTAQVETRMPVRTRVMPTHPSAEPSADPKRSKVVPPLLAGVFATVSLLGLVLVLTLPRASSLPEPTLTLAIAPIKTRAFAPSMTRGPLLFTDTFGPERGGLYWPITMDDPELYRNIENGAYRIWHRLRSTAVTSIFDEEAHSYATYHVYEADLTLMPDSQPDSAAGIIFRYRNDAMYYVFAVNGQGKVSIWRQQGEWFELRGETWTSAEGVKPAGQMNRLKVVDEEKVIRAYVNDVLVIEVKDTPIWFSGATGVYLATTQARVPEPYAEVLVDNFSVTEAKKS